MFRASSNTGVGYFKTDWMEVSEGWNIICERDGFGGIKPSSKLFEMVIEEMKNRYSADVIEAWICGIKISYADSEWKVEF